MRILTLAWVTAFALSSGTAFAADTPAAAPSGKVTTDAASTAPAPADDRQKLVDAGGQFMLGKYAEALDVAKTLIRSATDDAIKTGATRLAAECLRKKGEWQAAAGVYAKLRDRCEKGSDDAVKAEATAEVLQASPAGVYPPLEAKAAKAATAAAPAPASTAAPAPATVPAGETGATGATGATAPAASPDKPAVRNLSDDGYLAEALTYLATVRIEKMKARIAAIKKARTPQEAEAAFAALAEEMRQARILAGGLTDGPEQTVAKAASQRLAELGKQMIAALNTKLAEFQASMKNNALTQQQRKDMESFQTLCKALVECEGNFQSVTRTMQGLSGSDDAIQMRTDSDQRQTEYQRLSRAFVPPPADRWGGGGGFGRGGGGGGFGGGGRGGGRF